MEIIIMLDTKAVSSIETNRFLSEEAQQEDASVADADTGVDAQHIMLNLVIPCQLLSESLEVVLIINL